MEVEPTAASKSHPSGAGHANERAKTVQPDDIDSAALEKAVSRLAADRTALFHTANTSGGLTPDERRRLTTTEQELDECFLALRRQRAVRDSRRFGWEHPVVRRAVGPPLLPRGARNGKNV